MGKGLSLQSAQQACFQVCHFIIFYIANIFACATIIIFYTAIFNRPGVSRAFL